MLTGSNRVCMHPQKAADRTHWFQPGRHGFPQTCFVWDQPAPEIWWRSLKFGGVAPTWGDVWLIIGWPWTNGTKLGYIAPGPTPLSEPSSDRSCRWSYCDWLDAERDCLISNDFPTLLEYHRECTSDIYTIYWIGLATCAADPDSLRLNLSWKMHAETELFVNLS